MRNPFRKPEFTLEMTQEQAQSVRDGKGRIIFLEEGEKILPATGRDEALAHWQSAWHEQCILRRADERELSRVKSLVFMRLNSARDRKDKRAIELYRELQEAMR